MSNSIPSSLDKSQIGAQMPMANSSSPTCSKPIVGSSLLFRPISWLMFHANKLPKNSMSLEKDLFYTVKNKMLKKYGTYVRTDYQHFHGKKCFTCDGTGIYEEGFDWNDVVYCRSCDASGWFRHEKWVELSVYQFGKYQFHLPSFTRYVKPKVDNNIIESFIEHKKTKYTEFAFFVFMMLFYKKYFVWYYKSCRGWRCNWANPKNWLHNFCHIVLKKQNAIPFIGIRNKWNRIKEYLKFRRKNVSPNLEIDDRPF